MRTSGILAIAFLVLLVGAVTAGIAIERRATVAATDCDVDTTRAFLTVEQNGTANATHLAFRVVEHNPTATSVNMTGTYRADFYLEAFGGRLKPLMSMGQEALLPEGYVPPTLAPNGTYDFPDIVLSPTTLRGGEASGAYVVAVFAGKGVCGVGRGIVA